MRAGVVRNHLTPDEQAMATLAEVAAIEVRLKAFTSGTTPFHDEAVSVFLAHAPADLAHLLAALTAARAALEFTALRFHCDNHSGSFEDCDSVLICVPNRRALGRVS